MKVPVLIPLGGKKIKIEYIAHLVDDEGEPISATVIDFENRIQISTTATNHETEDGVFSTLFHELLHFASEFTGHREWMGVKREESLVYGLESMLAPLFKFRALPGLKWKEIKFAAEK